MKIYYYPEDKNKFAYNGVWQGNAVRINKMIVSMWGDKYNTYTVSAGRNSDDSYTGCFYPEVISLKEAKQRVIDRIKARVKPC